MRVRKLRNIGPRMAILHIKSGSQIPLSDRGRPVTQFALLRWAIATCFTLAGLVQIPVKAAEISVTVVDREGHGIADVAVTATPTRPGVAAMKDIKTAVMEHKNFAFTPR